MNTVVTQTAVPAPAKASYQDFQLGQFQFSRNEYFVTITWPAAGKQMVHTMAADAFLKALMRDVAWGFFYGWVNFDNVFGTRNLYGEVEVYGGRYNADFHEAGLDYVEKFDSAQAMATCKAILANWTNAEFDPFAAPDETGSAYGQKNGDNRAAIERQRETARRMIGAAGDAPMRSDATGHPVNRAFADVPQDAPQIHPAPGYEDKLAAFNLFAYLSRSDVTWNPSIVSVCKESLMCPTTEEHILPIIHGNDRVEWFIQLSDEIFWEIGDKETGRPRAKVMMRPGDVAAMPADIRHQGFSKKRAMLLVWENANPDLPHKYERGELPPYPVEF
jgi:hypothetical protein